MFYAVPKITPAQMKKLWAGAKELEWGDVELHALAQELTGRTSLRELSRDEAARLIDRLVALGASASTAPRRRAPRAAPLPENVIELATDRQISLIARLLHHVGWTTTDPYFRGAVRRAIGRENIRTKGEAAKVIALLRYKVRELGLEDQVRASHRNHGQPQAAVGGGGSLGADRDLKRGGSEGDLHDQPVGSEWDPWSKPLPEEFFK
jgi:hypothetical protein